jgi:hypothetical protein
MDSMEPELAMTRVEMAKYLRELGFTKERRAVMNTIKATVRGGRLEVEEPIDLPDGTELLIPLPNGPGQTDDDNWDNSPEGIADWLRWYESLEPLIITPEEEADTEAWLKKMDQEGLAKMDSRTEDLFR